MALNSLEEVLLREKNALKILILRETNRLTLGKKPVNFKIANFVRKYKQDNDVWSKFMDSISAEDLSRNLNVYVRRNESKFVLDRERSIVRRYLRLNSESRDVLKNFRVARWDSKMSGGPQVRVAQGELLGRTVTSPSGTTYYSFQGVPYAQPPIGSLRFKAPQYPMPWSGIRDATSPGPKPAQMFPYGRKKFEGSEDCMYLNIHTPKLPEDGTPNMPVMLYLSGGRYQVGDGAAYQPDYLMDKDVILVTMNYRLSIVGFLALGIPEVPGNAAMKDVVFALRWIKENISKFNGDANNVTVFGESAGAGTVSSLIASPMANGLFQKIILESGTLVHDLFLMKEDAVGKARSTAKILGKDTADPYELLAYLQSLPVETLIDTACDIQRERIDPRAYFSPIIEPLFEGVENFFPEDPIKCLKEGRYTKVPMIVGTNSHEGVFFMMGDKKGNYFYDTNLVNFIPRSFYADRKSDQSKRFAEELRQFYFGNREIGNETKEEYVNLVTDSFNLRDTSRFIEHALNYQSDIWWYKFSYLGSLNAPAMKVSGLKGASHSDQIPYQFYRPAKKNQQLSDDDRKIIAFFSESWSNFAKYGNPEATVANVKWPPASKSNKYCLNIDADFKLLTNPNEDRIKFWQHIYKKYGGEMSKL